MVQRRSQWVMVIPYQFPTLVNTNFCASKYQFTLQNTLCAPSIKRNFISVSQFCCDNQTSIEFFPFHYLVKDLTTGAPLVRGQSKSGLYEWPPGSTSTHPQCNLATPLHLRIGAWDIPTNAF